MKLLAGERALREAGEPGGIHFVLTTHRVRLEKQGIGQGQLVSIMLDEIASCAITRRSQPVILVIGAIFAILGVGYGFSTDRPAALFFGLVLGGLCLGLYLLTRQMVLEVGSADATIRLNIGGMSFASVVEIVDAIEEAKHRRYLLR